MKKADWQSAIERERCQQAIYSLMTIYSLLIVLGL